MAKTFGNNMEKMYLFIKTDNADSFVALFNENLKETSRLIIHGEMNHSEELLVFIERILSENGKTKNDLLGIFVFSGPCSYTGLRAGVATANALSFALDISVWPVDNTTPIEQMKNTVRSEKSKTFVSPKYLRAPHITKPKIDAKLVLGQNNKIELK